MTISQPNPHQLHPPADDAGPIFPVNASRRQEAVERLVGTGPPPRSTDPDHARRFLEYARKNCICLDHLFARRVDSTPDSPVHSAVLAVPSPGRTAMLFSSRVHTASDIRLQARLIAAACRSFTPPGLSPSPQVSGGRPEVCLTQTLLDLDDEPGCKAFLGAGFSELATLSYLERPLPTRRSAPQPIWPAEATTHSFTSDRNDELIGILDASYKSTLDCPGLCGLRTTRDILEGHRGTGSFTPNLWTILQVKNHPEGAILLNPTANGDHIELVYMGLSPHLRGRGLGRQLLRHGLSLLAGRSERTVTLAVDEQNSPALKLYRSEGFRPVVRRRAMIYPLYKG